MAIVRTQTERTLIGAAGEHLVLSRLYQRGQLAALAPIGTPSVDVLVLSTDASVVATVQVKTRSRGRDGGWHMSAKHEQLRDPSTFYAFVDLKPANPVVYVLPSAKVADVLTATHQAWLAAPGARGQQRNDSPMRRIQPAYPDGPVTDGWLEEWLERWELVAGH